MFKYYFSFFILTIIIISFHWFELTDKTPVFFIKLRPLAFSPVNQFSLGSVCSFYSSSLDFAVAALTDSITSFVTLET